VPPPATPGFLSQGAALRTPLFALWMDVSSLGKRSAPFLMVSRRGRRSASDVLVARRVFSQLSRSSRQYTTLRPKRRNCGEPPQQRILASVAGARPRSRAASRVFNFSFCAGHNFSNGPGLHRLCWPLLGRISLGPERIKTRRDFNLCCDSISSEHPGRSTDRPSFPR
jgi:hypothetical protein